MSLQYKESSIWWLAVFLKVKFWASGCKHRKKVEVATDGKTTAEQGRLILQRLLTIHRKPKQWGGKPSLRTGAKLAEIGWNFADTKKGIHKTSGQFIKFISRFSPKIRVLIVYHRNPIQTLIWHPIAWTSCGQFRNVITLPSSHGLLIVGLTAQLVDVRATGLLKALRFKSYGLRFQLSVLSFGGLEQ